MGEGEREGNPSVSFADSIPQFSMVAPLRSQARLWYSLLHWGLRTGLRFAGPVFRGCGALRAVPQFSMVVPLRSQARLWHSLLHWAYSALFRAQRARFVRPSPSAGRCSVPAHFVCSALQPFGPSPFCKHLLPKNTRNDVHAVISDLSLVLPILCQCSEGVDKSLAYQRPSRRQPWQNAGKMLCLLYRRRRESEPSSAARRFPI